MESISKEEFACMCLETVNGCRYLYARQVGGIIDSVRHRFRVTVDGMTDAELENYIKEELENVFG